MTGNYEEMPTTIPERRVSSGESLSRNMLFWYPHEPPDATQTLHGAAYHTPTDDGPENEVYRRNRHGQTVSIRTVPVLGPARVTAAISNYKLSPLNCRQNPSLAPFFLPLLRDSSRVSLLSTR